MLPKTNATAIPGKVLSQFRLPDYQLAEDYFAQQYLSTVAKAAAGQPVPVAKAMIDSANELVARAKFAFGTPGFDAAAQRPTYLPFLLWVALSAKNPTTQPEAAELITEENEEAVTLAVLQMMKYVLPPNASGAGSSPTPSPAPSTGPNSSEPSAPDTSDTPKPAA